MTDGEVLVDARGAVGWITFSNPAKRNALSAQMFAAALAAIEKLDGDASIRVIALRGADGTFVSGADIGGLSGSPGRADSAGPGILERAERAGKPVVALLEGWCLGGGVVLALAADLRIGTPGLTFGIPAARLGAAYPPDAVAALVRVAGPGMAAQLLLSGLPIDGRRAYEAGLLNWLFDEPEFEAGAAGVLGTLAANAPLTLLASKRAIAAAFDGNRGEAAAAVAACWTSADFTEGRAAFLAKRAPRFTGT
jgi:enoyl-CoA hydratase/carnithine racemase